MRFKHEVREYKSVAEIENCGGAVIGSFWTSNSFGVTAHKKFREVVLKKDPSAIRERDTSIAKVHYRAPDGMTVWELR